jgi:Ca2+-binding EF-hand superfamily protein
MIKVQPVDPRWRFVVDRIESGIARDYTTRHDQNANGVVERSEFSGNDDAFTRTDRNENGRLELSEVKGYVNLLRQHELNRDSERAEQTAQSGKGSSFSVSPHARLTSSVRDYFSEEVRSLDRNTNGFIDKGEFVGRAEEFSSMDQDQNSLVSARERAEGFLDNQTDLQMALKAYRFSHGLFQNRGGILQTAV